MLPSGAVRTSSPRSGLHLWGRAAGLLAVLLLAACVDDGSRCGAHARVYKAPLTLQCQTWAALDAQPADAPVADAPVMRPDATPMPRDGGMADAPPKGTWGDPCTKDEDCGRPDPVNGTTTRCGIQPNGMPFPGQTGGICTKAGCDLNDPATCPGDWTCIDPADFNFAGFPIACWCFARGGGANCTP